MATNNLENLAANYLALFDLAPLMKTLSNTQRELVVGNIEKNPPNMWDEWIKEKLICANPSYWKKYFAVVTGDTQR